MIRKPLRILHVSDLHERAAFEGMPVDRQPRVQWDARQRGQVLGPNFLEALRDVAKEGVDLVCFTGDVADWGHPAEYAKASARVTSILEAVGVPRKHFFAIPGNHDVQRNVRPDAWQGIRDWLARMPDGAAKIGRWFHHVEGPPPGVRDTWREEVAERTAGFWSWLDAFGRPDLRPRHPAPFGYRQVLAAGTFAHIPRPVHIIGFDSAWLCGSDQDQGRLLLMEEQVEAHIRDGESQLDGLRIGLVHHPLDHLADHHAVRRLLADSGVDILLHGHQHAPLTMVVDEPGARLRIVAGGCLMEGDVGKGWPNGFSLLEVHPTDGSGAVHFRKWSRDGRFWAIGSDIYRDAPQGILKFGAAAPAADRVIVADRPDHGAAPAKPSIYQACLAQRAAWDAAETSTVEDGVVRLRVRADGSWKGGIDGLRPAVIRLLRQAGPALQVQVLHENPMNLCAEYLALEGAAALTVEQGKRLDGLQSHLPETLANAARMATAVRVVFMPSTPNVRFSLPADVGLDTERGIAFLDGLLRQAYLAPSSGRGRTIYHPRDPATLWTTTSVDDKSAAIFRTRWTDALKRKFGASYDPDPEADVYYAKRRAYDLALVPGWALSYEHVAALMLPATVWSILSRIDLSDAADIDEVRRRTGEAFPALETREVWDPHAWVVSLKSQASLKDLAFASQPPGAAHELE